MGAAAMAADLVDDTLSVTAEQFCEEYAPAVCRFAAMAARSASEAEDIAQEALLHAVRRLDTFDPARGDIGAWLWRIVANVARDHMRAERRRWTLLARLTRFREATPESVETIALDHIDNERLLAAVRRMDPRARTLIALRFGADLDLRSTGRGARHQRGRGGQSNSQGPRKTSTSAGGQAMIKSTDGLAERLRELPLDEPRPEVVTARVLAAAERPGSLRAIGRDQRRARPRLLTIGAALLVIVLGSWAVLYYSPATAAALADATGPGGFSAAILGHVGLSARTITAENSSATSSGYTVQLVGAYADSIRTVILLKSTPAAYFGGTPLQLTDQFGTTYNPTSGEGNLITGDQVDSFEPASWLASFTGMRFTLTMDEGSLLSGQHLTGSWTVKGVVLLNSGTTLETPARGSLGPGSVRFTDARYAGRTVSIRAEVSGVSVDGVVPPAVPGAKPQPALSVALVPANGGLQIPMFGLNESSSGDVSQLEMLFVDVDSGRYFIVISVAGVGTLSSALVVT